ncbi:putative gpi-anchored cell wall organization protein ecm33 [Neofusicoccum parvum]|nr:putative gpi-anchored cell wall organization protein ecm33 [Neofusicoccum parvum]
MVYSTKLRSIAASGLLVGAAAAADCSAPSGGILTVGVEDVLDLASCKTFDGSIQIAKDVWDSISLDGIEEITGSLIVEGAETLTYFSADSLTSVGSLELSDSTLLTGFDLPSLSSVSSLSLSSLPLLWEVDFGSSIEQCSTVEVRDTYLTHLDLDIAEPESIIIEQNDFLWSVSVSSTTVSEEIYIGGNGNAVDVSFPQLESANKVTFSNASSLSLPSLTEVSSSLIIKDGFIADEGFDLSSLTTVGGDLEISGLWDLTTLSLSNLKSIGGDFKISDSSFSSISFESLETVSGSVIFEGDISEVSFDSLTEVGGSWEISGSTSFSCEQWSAESSVVKGEVNCGTSDEHEEPPAAETATPVRSTPVASIPTDIASTPALSIPAVSIPAVSTPASVPTTPHAPTTLKPSVPAASSSLIVETTWINGSSVVFTSATPVPTTPGVVGTPVPTPSIPITPFDGAATTVGPVAGLIGLMSAAVMFCLL